MRRFARLLALAVVPVTFAAATAERNPPASTPLVRPPAAASAPRLPLLVVENAGQTDERVALYAKTPSGTAYFTGEGITWGIVRGGSRWALKLDFADAREDARPQGEDAAATAVSYLKGPRADWHAGLRTWRKLRYRDLWPGIDLVYETQDGALKYSFEVAPGADPSRIAFDVRGAESLRVDGAGRLVATTPLGGYRDDRPVSWQERPDGRVPVRTAFDVRDRRVAFRVGAYDPALPLVIDPPTVVYTSSYGGAGVDLAGGVAVGSDGSVYVAGRTTSNETTFPVQAGFDLTFSGDEDAYVAKINAAGDAFVYVTYLGGPGVEVATDIELGGAGEACVCGYTTSATGFPAVVGPDLTYGGGASDGFTAKLNAAGTGLVYAGFIGGAGHSFLYDDIPFGLDLDAAGRAYVVGSTAATQTTFPTAGAIDATHNGGSDIYVVVVSADGSAFELAGFVGGPGGESGRGVAVGPGNSIYLCGKTDNAQAFPAVVGPSLTPGGLDDGLCVKLSPSGAVQWAGFWGGVAYDAALAVDTDAAGNAYFVGYTNSRQSSGFPVVDALDGTQNGDYDACFARVFADGSAFDVSSFLGGAGADEAVDCRVTEGAAGETLLTIAGTCTSDGTFPVKDGPNVTPNGGDDAFVTRIAFLHDGTEADATLAFSGFAGTPGSDRCEAVAVGTEPACSGCVVVVYNTQSADVGGATSLCGPCDDTPPTVVVAKIDPGPAAVAGGTNHLTPVSLHRATGPAGSGVSQLRGSFICDLGGTGIDGTKPITLTINGHEIVLDPSRHSVGRTAVNTTHVLSGAGLSGYLRTGRNSSTTSRVNLVFEISGDLTGILTAASDVAIEVSQDAGAAAVVRLEDGCFTSNKNPCAKKRGKGVVVEPAIGPTAIGASLKGIGRVLGTFRLGDVGDLTGAAPDVSFAFGTGLTLDVPGATATPTKTGWTYPIPGGAGGGGAAGTVKLHAAKRLLTVDVKGVTLTDVPDGSSAVDVKVKVGATERQFRPIMNRLGKRIYW